jgi:NAD(P)-dependent dehydrogenase (short-subunit alcohol dehydrogenase family)
MSAFDELTGRVALVTGAGRSIGLAIARRLLDRGAKVAVHSRSAVRSSEIEAAIASGNAIILPGQLENPVDRAELFRRVADRFGALSILVNNAATQSFETIACGDCEAFERLLRVNVVAAVDCMRRAAEAMQDQEGDRCIVNIVSIRATRPGAGGALYAASKAALLSATRSAAIEFGPRGVRVNAVSPGLVWREGLETEWPEGARNFRDVAPLRRIGQPDDIANACVMLASPAAGWITGIDLAVDGGMSLVR